MAGYVRKLKSGKYRIEYMKDGVKYSKNITASNISEAKKILAKIVTDIEIGTFQKVNSMRFVDFAQLWIDTYAKKLLSETTTRNYKNMLNKYILSQIGSMKLTDIRKPHILDILSILKSNSLSSNTQNKYLKLLSVIFNTAIEWDYIKFNPAAHIKIRRDSSEEKVSMQIYNKKELEEFKQALDNCEDTDFKNMVLITLLTGLRRGELMGLQPQDIDYENSSLTISRNRVCVPDGTLIKGTKNHKTRTFKIPSTALEILKEASFQKKKGELIFGEHPDTFTYQFTKFLRQNKLKHIRVYDLRHMNASILQSQGIDFATIANRLGNLPSTTAQFYIHKIDEKDEEACEILETII